MSNIKWIQSTKVSDGKGGSVEVRVGDGVLLLPSRENQSAPVKSFRPEWGIGGTKWMQEFLGGEGPYEIANIGLWPCGGVNLYFKDRKTGASGPGASSRDFYAETS